MNRLLARNLAVLLLGVGFGILLVKGRIASWYRIQEMFWFEGFHLYGVIGSALAVAATGVWLIRRSGARTLRGETITIPAKPVDHGNWIGGLIFGIGWALVGACPGPVYALLGAVGAPALLILLSALAGAWAYGALKPRLPH
ncbi:MAG: hypothetical protein RL026_73 [Pseudomonadota bacterium]|jgi:uncharacterized membrane protein YedE/YeeE